MSTALMRGSATTTAYGATCDAETAEGPIVLTRKPVPAVIQPTKLVTSFSEPVQEVPLSEMVAPYLCEFVGTFMLVFTFAMCVCNSGNKTWATTGVSCVVVVLIYSVGFVSGGHFNPAVSLSALLAGKMPGAKFVGYVVLQIIAGLLAGCIFDAIFQSGGTMVMPIAPFHFAPAAVIEVLYTALLCFVGLNVVGSMRNNPENEKNHFFALAIGFVVIAAGYAGGSISGAIINPSIALGLNLADCQHGGSILWGILYTVMELIGGSLAALLFWMCRSEDFLPEHGRHTPEGYYIDSLASYTPPLAVRSFSEFLGSFYLVLTFGLNVILLSSATAWSVSAVLVSTIYALGNVSGGHFNPAVTTAVVLSGRGKCSVKDGVYYMLSQLLGGIVASIFLSYFHHHALTAHVEFGLFGLSISSPYHFSAVATVEILFTFLLTYAALAVYTVDEYAVSSKSRQSFYFGLAMGFAMCAGCVASSGVSGGYLNPATALGFYAEAFSGVSAHAAVKGWPAFANDILWGIAIVSKFIGELWHWILYSFLELVGAVLAAGVFRLTHPAEYQKKMPTLITYVQHGQ